MIDRLARVIYWVGCLFLIVMSAMVAFEFINGGWISDALVMWVFLGFIPWGMCYAIRYILSAAKNLKPWG